MDCKLSIAKWGLAATIALSGASAGAFHGTSCSATPTGAAYTKKTMAHAAGTIDTVQPKKIDVYILKGMTNVIVQGSGDVDISLCEVGGTGHVCESSEILTPDACSGLARAKTYRLDVMHCTERACGYPADSPLGVTYALIVA